MTTHLEAEICKFFGTENAISYTSCFDDNTGLFETILKEGDAIFSDELNHPVKMVDPYISISAQDGEEHIVCSICIDFRKTRPNDKELNFIFNTFSHIRNTLKGDYKIEGVWEDIFGREYDSINPRNMMENIDRRGIKEM